jgi:hypothetical protein
MSRYTGYFIIVNQALSQKNRFQNRTGGKRQPGSKNLQILSSRKSGDFRLLRNDVWPRAGTVFRAKATAQGERSMW